MVRSSFRQRFASFAVWMPVLDLAIWAGLVLTLAVLLFVQAHDVSIGPSDAVHADYTFDVRQDDLLDIPLTNISVSRSHVISAISLPATVVEGMFSLPLVRPSSWHPADLRMDSWRALTYPIYCLPVWWFVGRGMDSLFGKRSLGWLSKLAGIFLLLLFTSIWIGFRYGFKGDDPNGDLQWILRALGIWILMFAVFPAVWLKQAFLPKLTELLQKRMAE